MRKIATMLLFCLLGITSACEQTYVPQKPQVSFSGEPYILNVASMNVIDEYKTSKTLPHVEGLSDIPPSEAIHQWAAARMIAKGQSGYAEIVIKDARITRKTMPKQKTGLEGYFTTEQTEEYSGRLEVEIKIYDGASSLPVAHLSTYSQSSLTLAENATLVDHSNAYHQISVDLIKALEPQLDRNIRGHFGKYLL